MTDQHPTADQGNANPHLAAGTYALDALDEDDRRTFEAHLDKCSDCRDDVARFREALAAATADTTATPPPRLRTDILATIAAVDQLEPEPRPRPANRTSHSNISAPHQHSSATVTTTRFRPRWRRIAEISIAAVVALVLAFGGWAVGRHHQNQTLQAAQSAQQRLLNAPDVQLYHHPIPNGQVTYVVSRSQNAAMVLTAGRPDPGHGHVFQLWTMHAQAQHTVPQPDQTFTGNQTRPTWLTGNITDASAIAITTEPEGGSPTPTTTPFAVQQL